MIEWLEDGEQPLHPGGPPCCDFCKEPGVGIYAHSMYPVSFSVCDKHRDKLHEDFLEMREEETVIKIKNEYPYWETFGDSLVYVQGPPGDNGNSKPCEAQDTIKVAASMVPWVPVR